MTKQIQVLDFGNRGQDLSDPEYVALENLMEAEADAWLDYGLQADYATPYVAEMLFKLVRDDQYAVEVRLAAMKDDGSMEWEPTYATAWFVIKREKWDAIKGPWEQYMKEPVDQVTMKVW